MAIPEAESVVQRFRAQLDSGAALGVPAHVTVLYPFVAPASIDDDLVAELEQLFRSVEAFESRFDEVGWFGREVVYLRPTPEDRFRLLTSLVWKKWPEFPPYGGEHGDPIPHLTIGDNGDPVALSTAADAIRLTLPIESRVVEVQLFTGSFTPGSWRWQWSFALG